MIEFRLIVENFFAITHLSEKENKLGGKSIKP